MDATVFEADLEANRSALETAARAALDSLGEAAARSTLTQGCLHLAARAEDYLRSRA